MADITPPNNVALNAAQTSAMQADENNTMAALGQADIVELPDKLQNLTRPALLGAQVGPANPDGTVTLKTAAGDFVIKPQTPLPPTLQSVMIQVQPSQDGQQQSATMYSNSQQSVAQNISTQNSSISLAGTLAATTSASTSVKPEVLQNISSANIFPTLIPGAVVAATVVQAAPQTFEDNNKQPFHQNEQAPDQQFAQPRSTAQNSSGATVNLPKNANPELPDIPNPSNRFSNALPLAQGSLSPRLLETVQQTMSLLDAEAAPAKQEFSVPNNIFAKTAAGTVLSPQANVAALPPGSQIMVQVTQIGTAPMPQNMTPQTQNNNIELAGKIVSVIAQDNGNAQLIVDTEMGQIALPTNIAAGKPAIGTNVALQWIAQPPGVPPNLQGALPQLLPLNAAQPKEWPALDTMLQNVAAQNTTALSNLANTVPKLNGHLPTTALFFMSALRTGKIENWLGDNLEMAEDANGDSASGVKELLGKDFAGLKNAKVESQQGEWKLYQMPLLSDQGLNRLQLAVRDHYEPLSGDDKGSEQSRVTRFVVDVDYSAYGEVQLDGFMREKKMDVVVRSQGAFPDNMRHEVLGLYNDALESQGMNGTLTFQVGYANWIKLMQNNQPSNYSA